MVISYAPIMPNTIHIVINIYRDIDDVIYGHS